MFCVDRCAMAIQSCEQIVRASLREANPCVEHIERWHLHFSLPYSIYVPRQLDRWSIFKNGILTVTRTSWPAKRKIMKIKIYKYRTNATDQRRFDLSPLNTSRIARSCTSGRFRKISRYRGNIRTLPEDIIILLFSPRARINARGSKTNDDGRSSESSGGSGGGG